MPTVLSHSARFAAIAALTIAALALPDGAAPAFGGTAAPLPARLSGTGLFEDGAAVNAAARVRAANLPFSPQYPLWSDGTTKRRWLYLPPGTSIDASRPDAWEFPRGTRLWKEFSFGRPIETRFIERLADGSWRFATYVWNEDGTDATLAPASGFRALPVAAAPSGRYAVPSQGDCLACHEGAAVPVLGVSALQLSPDRDPLAPHADLASEATANDLRALVARGWLKNLPRELIETPPRIAASSPVERAALGYLHGNCGHCHNDAADGAVPVGVRLAQSVAGAGAERSHDGSAPPAVASLQVLASLLGATSRFQSAGNTDLRVVAPGHAERSVLVQRMRARNPRTQMPPLGTQVPDAEGLALIERWINHELQARISTPPTPLAPLSTTQPTTHLTPQEPKS